MKTYLSIAAVVLCTAAYAQYQTGFEAGEGYNGSAGGTDVTGQNGWYIPIDGSANGFVYTYAGNGLSAPNNPGGGGQFMGEVDNSAFSLIVARAQHDMTFSGTGTWTATYEFCPFFNGLPPASDNLGSFSLQPSATANYFQTLYHWPDVNNPVTFIADYGVADAGGTFAFQSPGVDWQALPCSHWYKSSTTWDYSTNAIVSVSIQDITTGAQPLTFQPTGWYLAGGANNVLGKPVATAIRCFAGGSVDGNVMCWDNIKVGPATSSERLAPVAQTVNLGKISSGNLASLAADDNNPEVICKFFVPNLASPFVSTILTFNTTKASPTAMSFEVKAKWNNAGAYQISLLQHNYSTNADDTTMAYTNLGGTYTVFTGTAAGTLTNYVSGGNTSARILVKQTGPSTALLPCVSFEYANQIVTG